MPLDPARVVTRLEELRALTGDENGAQRVAFTETWTRGATGCGRARGPAGRVRPRRGRQPGTRSGGVRARSPDRRPHGLGAERRLARRLPQRDRRRRDPAALAAEGTPPVTVRLVDWADEEGARFGRSSSDPPRAPGTMADQDERRKLDRDGVSLPDALGRPASTSNGRRRRAQARNAAAYLELHIEQGPVLDPRPAARRGARHLRRRAPRITFRARPRTPAARR